MSDQTAWLMPDGTVQLPTPPQITSAWISATPDGPVSQVTVFTPNDELRQIAARLMDGAHRTFEVLREWMQRMCEGITRASRALARAFGLSPCGVRSSSRTLRRLAGPVTRAQRIDRKARRRALTAIPRQARRG